MIYFCKEFSSDCDSISCKPLSNSSITEVIPSRELSNSGNREIKAAKEGVRISDARINSSDSLLEMTKTANSNDPLATVNRSQTIRFFKQNSRPTGDLSPSGWSIITNLVVKDYLAASAPAILPYTVAITSPEIPPPPSPA